MALVYNVINGAFPPKPAFTEHLLPDLKDKVCQHHDTFFPASIISSLPLLFTRTFSSMLRLMYMCVYVFP